MRRSASEIIRSLEMRVAQLEKEAKDSYPWDDCMKDQMEQYGDEEIASKVCGKIKAQSQGLGKSASVTERDVIDAMNKFKSLYEAGFLDKATYEKHWDRLQDQLAEFRLWDPDGNWQEDEYDPSKPEVGDIILSRSGPKKNLVDFYKVTEVGFRGNLITLQKLENKIVQGDENEGYVVPSKREDKREKPLKKKVIPNEFGYSVVMSRLTKGVLWDEDKEYFRR